MAASSNSLPAPKTFAPSREDVLSTLGFFFGDPVVPEKLKDYSEHHAMTYHFPDAFYGQNNKIRETLNSLILNSPQEWQTSVALPFVRIEGTTVEWDEMKFDVRLLQRVPYEGISRMQTSLRRRHRDRVVRRGIAMTIESDFYATEAGRKHFSDQLTSIRYCVQETCNFDCLFSYLTCGNYDFRYDLQKGLRPRRHVRTAMAKEIAAYAIVQKEGLGLDKAVEDAKARMSRYSVTPNMLIVPPQLLLYMSTAPNEKLSYQLAGPEGAARFEAGVAGFEARAFRGMGIFTSMPYEVNDDTDSLQMLQRSTQVGEFYRMAPPPGGFKAGVSRAGTRDIVIYDEESDKHVHIKWADAFNACPISAAQIGTLGGEGTPSDDETNTDNDNWEIVIVRPFMEHLMMSAVMAVSGRDTGATLFGPADMQISANTSVKTIEGHYTCHTKSVITKPQNVMVLRDIMCNGYVAGGNTKFFGHGMPGGYTAANIQQSISDRLAMGDDTDGDFPSMLAFLVPKDEDSRDQVISISQRLLPWETASNGVGPGDKKYFPGGLSGWNVYKDLYRLESIHFGEDIRAAENQEFITQGSVNNSLCFIGPHRVYSQWSKTFYELTPGQGHFGPDALPGDARWRRGESVSLKDARNSMVSIEAAAHAQMVFNGPNTQ